MRICATVSFSGNALEAIRFYTKVFNAQPEYFTYADMPPCPDFPITEEIKDKVMHGELALTNDQSLMFSDDMRPGRGNMGNAFSLMLLLDDEDELRRIFAALAEGGSVTTPPAATFWSVCYGDLIDRFGITWGLNLCREPEGFEAMQAKARRE